MRIIQLTDTCVTIRVLLLLVLLLVNQHRAALCSAHGQTWIDQGTQDNERGLSWDYYSAIYIPGLSTAVVCLV